MKMTGGCEVCNGTGEVTEVIRVDDYYKDPWVLKPQARNPSSMSPELRKQRLEAYQSAEDEFFAEEDESEPVCTIDRLHDALKHLTARQRFVVELRYGMRDGRVYAVADVAAMMGISHVAVTKFEQAAVASLARGLHA